jgi:hypothetical protein
MIFLIDDKKQRQLGYGWNEMKIEKFNPFLKPIYSYDQILNDSIREEIFSPGSVVLFHESFFDAESNRHAKNSMTIRIELEKYAKKTENFKLVFFSGSKNSRYQDKNVVYLPVSQLYINLENFIVNYSKGDSDLRFLLYGSNHLIEEYLINSYIKANNEIDQLLDYDSQSINLYIRPFQNFIQKPLLKFDEQTIFNKVSDDDLNDLVLKWLNHKKYQNVFIPLCFGPVLSDFNGLRLALHIRTTSTLSQFANICIYGIVDHSYLVQNDYYDVLKTKNVRLIDYKKSSFRDALFLNFSDLNMDNLSVELDKIKLNPPGNYYDNHSIANVWGVYQLARNANIKIDEIKGFEKEKLSDIYFKWLITKNNLKIPISEEQKNEQIIYAEKLEGVKVIGKIDLSKFKRK